MARPIDPARHAAQRLRIVDAALTCVARAGLDGATTAQISAEAGIGSGTFFHYFPTKAAVLQAIFEIGTAEQQAWFASRSGRTDALGVLLEHATHVAHEAADPRVAGFVTAVSAALHRPEVADALDAEQRAVREGLRPWVEAARAAGEVRDDWGVEETLDWIVTLEEGFVASVATLPGFDAAQRADALRDVIHRALAPTSTVEPTR